MAERIQEGDLVMHFKGNAYEVLDTHVYWHEPPHERLVLYKALAGSQKTYVRPYDMFVSEVDHDKYPDVKQKYRFEVI